MGRAGGTYWTEENVENVLICKLKEGENSEGIGVS